MATKEALQLYYLHLINELLCVCVQNLISNIPKEKKKFAVPCYGMLLLLLSLSLGVCFINRRSYFK